MLRKYGGQISQAAHQKTKEETNYAENSPEFNDYKHNQIRDIVRDSFGIIGKPSDKWTHDQSYFFNRRSEMGFTRDNGVNLVAGMFGRELFELIYPNWWGGQGKASHAPLTQKVNDKIYEPGTNFARYINRPGWNDSVPADTINQRTIEFTQTAQNPENLQSEYKQIVPHSTRYPEKELIDPISMTVAGVPTGGFRPHVMQNTFNPNNYYGFDGLLNGGGHPVYPTYKPHEFQPPAHIPQVRDPTLRSLYQKKTN